MVTQAPERTLLDMNRYQWTVLLAAWLGWGFDCFDAILFNYVAPNCVPTLLQIPLGTPEAGRATLHWTGIFTSLLLLGWAAGGILFGKVADRLGRTKTLLLTMALYSLGTAACAAAPNLWVLAAFRLVASLGIGGEWAAGAAMVAEVVPEKRRLEAGALLYTAAPLGLVLATVVNKQVAGVYLKDVPEVAWRYVFLFGLLPAAVAFVVRAFVKEPERWKEVASKHAPPRLKELFSPEFRKATFSGLGLAMAALLMWWSCSAFLPIVSSNLAKLSAPPEVLAHKPALNAFVEEWKAFANNSFNLGGLLGTLLTVPAAKFLGRRVMFGGYFFLSAAAIMAAFGLDLEPRLRLYMFFPIGLFVFGVFGSFTYYLPELYPTRLRGTGAGFCYNAGRVIAALGPFLVGHVASLGADTLKTALQALFYVGFIPLAALLLLPWVVETKDRALED
jgi:MFS family permease